VPVRLCIAAALALHVLTAWLHKGFLNPDEHYQILEFAWAKLGNGPWSALPWEFAARIRPAIQPVIAAAVIRAFELAGLFNPFVVAFTLRLLSALLGLWVTVAVCARALPWLRHERLQRFAFLASLFFWAAATVHGRYSSENWGGIWLFGGLCLALDAVGDEPVDRRRALALAAAAGAAWGIAFYCRFQVGVAIAGIAAWMVVVRRSPWKIVAAAALGGLVVIALNVCVDRWFYGEWVLTPINYFRVNLLQGAAATFGTSPPWVTLLPFVWTLGPPLSFAFIATVAAGIWFARRNVLVWTVVPFVAVHAAIAHKEARFMAPVIYGLVPLIAISIDSLPAAVIGPLSRWGLRWPGRLVVGIMWAANALALVAVTVVPVTVLPVNERAGLLQWLWDDCHASAATLYSINRAPYDDLLPLNFYRPPKLRVAKLSQLGSDVASGAVNARRALVLYEGTAPLFLVPPVPVECRPLVRSQPDWFLSVGRIRWLPRTRVWTICEARPR